MNLDRQILIFLIRGYQRVVSPALMGLFGSSGCCRFEPSCSHYAIKAIELHGAGRGSTLAVGRVCRCHPWGGHGFDPVPENAVAKKREALIAS